MRLIKVVFAGMLSCLFALTAQASDRDFGEIYTECGLGALIAPRTPVVAAVTNVTWDLGTTAITSDASSENNCMGVRSNATAFMLQSYPSLERELAQGTGEHLNALLYIAGCEDTSQSEISLVLRDGFAEMVARDGYATQTRYEKAEGFFELFTKRVSEEYADVCTLS